jgi:hypothetical protein
LTVAICEALATESRGRPVARFGSKVLPGAFASRRLLVRTQTTTVLMRLALTSSRWRTSAGWRYPGFEPLGSPKSTYHTWPRRIIAGLPGFIDHAVPGLGGVQGMTPPGHELARRLSQEPTAGHF